jgi:drug/metabolite transporter (DMT)-like permease
MGARIGAVAALATAVSWTVTALAFEYAANRIGPLLLNFLRLVVGFLFLGLWCLFTQGSFLPLSAPPSAWLWLAASGIVGFVAGDLLLFQGFIDIGSRISMLIYASAPALTAVLGFGILGERLAGLALLGMALTLAGIAIVVLSPRAREDPPEAGRAGKNRTRGILCAFGGALGQAAGLILSKIGAGTMNPFAGTEIRVSAGIVGFVLVLTATGAWRGMGKAVRDARSLASLSVGSFFGPFLGVSLSLLAVQSMQAGIAAAIMSIVPVLIIAPSAVLYRERIRVRDVAGSAIAVLGVFVLFIT